MHKFINLVFFQSLWFLAVLGAAQNNCWYAIVGLATFLIAHYFVSPTAKADFILATGAVLAGLIIESGFLMSGLLVYNCNEFWPQLAPVWMLVLWANFALTMNGCLQWLQERYLLAAALGALGGPLSYFGGVQLGAATTEAPLWLVLGTVGLIYAIATPLLLAGAQRLREGSHGAR